jgi:hypothetical protein
MYIHFEKEMVENVVHKVKNKNAYRVLTGKPEGKRPFRRPRRR